MSVTSGIRKFIVDLLSCLEKGRKSLFNPRSCRIGESGSSNYVTSIGEMMAQSGVVRLLRERRMARSMADTSASYDGAR